ncbi:hypothetical protein HaLaN_28509, partial [Haematococcus lacustris]
MQGPCPHTALSWGEQSSSESLPAVGRCSKDLDLSKPTWLEGWKPQPGQVQNRLLRSAWSKRFEAPVRGLMWCPQLHQNTPGGKWVDRDCNAALNLQRAGESKWRPLELCRWPPRSGFCQWQGIPSIGLQEAARPRPQGPSPAACSTVACVHRAMLRLLLSSEHVFHANIGCLLSQGGRGRKVGIGAGCLLHANSSDNR